MSLYVSRKKKNQRDKHSLWSKLAMGQRYWTSTRRILRSSSLVSVLAYGRLAWGLTDVSYEGTMGEPDRSSDRLVMLADLEIKTQSENTVINLSSIHSFLDKCLFANVKSTCKSSSDGYVCCYHWRKLGEEHPEILYTIFPTSMLV